MKKFKICVVVVCVLMLVCTAVFAADPKLPELRRDVNDKAIPPTAVYNPATKAYELPYFSADANGYLNVTIASGSVTIPTPVPVTGTFWPDTQPVQNSAYVGKVSSGTSDLITGTDTYTIAVADNVTDYSFLYDNDTDTDNYIDIKLSHTGDSIRLKNGQSYVKSNIVVPAPITFMMTNMQTVSSTTFKIDTVK